MRVLSSRLHSHTPRRRSDWQTSVLDLALAQLCSFTLTYVSVEKPVRQTRFAPFGIPPPILTVHPRCEDSPEKMSAVHFPVLPKS